jgi:hypothetical protein
LKNTIPRNQLSSFPMAVLQRADRLGPEKRDKTQNALHNLMARAAQGNY